MARTSKDEFSKATKAAAFLRSKGRCECGCGDKIIDGHVEYDHKIEVALGGDNSLENCVVMRTKCHSRKSRERAGPLAKVRRIKERNMGLRKTARPLPGSKSSGWKHKMSGEWERR